MIDYDRQIKKIHYSVEKKKHNLFKKKKVKNKGNLRRAVTRDKRCLSCGSKSQLSAHHIIFKSLGGDDSLDNLMTLCFDCHRFAHDGAQIVDHFVNGKKFIIRILERLDLMLFAETLERLKNEVQINNK